MMVIKYCVMKSVEGKNNKILFTKSFKDSLAVYNRLHEELKRECKENRCIGDVYIMEILVSKMEVG